MEKVFHLLLILGLYSCNGDLGFENGNMGLRECTMMGIDPARRVREGFLEEVTVGPRSEG